MLRGEFYLPYGVTLNNKESYIHGNDIFSYYNVYIYICDAKELF